MKLKRIVALILILAVACNLGACKSRTGSKKEKQSGADESVSAVEAPALPEEAENPEPESKPEERISTVEPRNKADDFLRAARTGEREQIQSFTDYNSLFGLAEGQNPEWILQQVLMRMTYEITAVAVEADSGEKAIVTALISTIDMNVVLPAYFQQAMELEFKNALSDSPIEPAALENEYRKIFAKIASTNSEKRVQNEVDITLESEDGEWVVKPDRKVGDALLGGYLEARENISQTAQIETPPAGSEAAAGYVDDASPKPDAGQGNVNDPSPEQGYANDDFSMVPPRE